MISNYRHFVGNIESLRKRAKKKVISKYFNFVRNIDVNEQELKIEFLGKNKIFLGDIKL